METKQNFIEFNDVVISYSNTEIIKKINLVIDEGKFTIVVGSSGSGKTTLVKSINGLNEISNGTLSINGAEINSMTKFEKATNVGYVVQRGGLFNNMTIKSNLLLARPAHLKRAIIRLKAKFKKGEITKEKLNEKITYEKNEGNFSKSVFLIKIKKLFKELHLDEKLLAKIPSQLSGGQLQRVGIIRSFVLDTEIIVMDEPFSALDPIVKRALQNITYKLMKEYKKTIIMVSHDPDEILALADEIIILKDGKMYKNKKWTSDEIRKSKDKWIRTFFLFDTVNDLSKLGDS